MNHNSVYSHNEEDWVEELQEAIDAAIEQQDCQPEEINMKIGDKVLITHDQLSNGVGSNVIEQLQEWAYDECQDWADNYLEDIGKDKIDELSDIIGKWISENAEAPTFYKVVNIRDFECSADIALSF